ASVTLFTWRRSAAARSDGLRRLYRIVGQWIFRIVQIRDHVVRGAAREALDVRILDDRLVELREGNVDQREGPTIVHARVAARGGSRVAGRDRAIEHHVVFLVGVHGQVVDRRDGTHIQRRAHPGVFRRIERLPRYLDVGRIRVESDVSADAREVLAVDID